MREGRGFLHQALRASEIPSQLTYKANGPRPFFWRGEDSPGATGLGWEGTSPKRPELWEPQPFRTPRFSSMGVLGPPHLPDAGNGERGFWNEGESCPLSYLAWLGRVGRGPTPGLFQPHRFSLTTFTFKVPSGDPRPLLTRHKLTSWATLRGG